MSRSTDILISGIAGLAVGFTAGILLAPQSGKETRDQISHKVDDLVKELDTLKDKTAEMANNATNSANEAAKKEAETKS
ncbi:YtxH domain-containing protein [Salibacter sp.]|uniref:YtxH domain-containing protein n=1 Tax=Salibacter sp. TaxID=2010995 RepID=UPI00286FF593|nr:YtxH domain-containing protein [Salibacter sp.]MDR9397846.1 YtxH domain-containing protein [Salibacter sp.]MDR9486632.1 YtxH domain-containing protein [Salibacter sp.]